MSTRTALEELTLCLWGCKVGAGALEGAAALRQLPRLRCLGLDFYDSGVDSAGTAALTQAAAALEQLEVLTLDLRWRFVTAAAALAVAEALMTPPRLRDLTLYLFGEALDPALQMA